MRLAPGITRRQFLAGAGMTAAAAFTASHVPAQELGPGHHPLNLEYGRGHALPPAIAVDGFNWFGCRLCR